MKNFNIDEFKFGVVIGGKIYDSEKSTFLAIASVAEDWFCFSGCGTDYYKVLFYKTINGKYFMVKIPSVWWSRKRFNPKYAFIDRRSLQEDREYMKG